MTTEQELQDFIDSDAANAGADVEVDGQTYQSGTDDFNRVLDAILGPAGEGDLTRAFMPATDAYGSDYTGDEANRGIESRTKDVALDLGKDLDIKTAAPSSMINKLFKEWGFSDENGKMSDASKMAMTLLGTTAAGLYKSYADQKKLAIDKQEADQKGDYYNTLANAQRIEAAGKLGVQNMKFTKPGLINYQPVTPNLPRIGG